MYTNFEVFFANFSFLILFISMLIYWIQASNNTPPAAFLKSERNFFDYISRFFCYISNERYIGIFLTMLANICLFLLLLLRWIESGHFPLSNLYESLMFLSWSLTFIHLFIEFLFASKNSFNISFLINKPKQNINSNLTLITNEGSITKQESIMSMPEKHQNNTVTPINNIKSMSKEHKQEITVQNQFIDRGEAADKQQSLSLIVEGPQKTSESPNLLDCNKKTTTKPWADIKLIGSITAPCALFTNAFATFSLPKEMQEASPLVPALQSNWLMMHVTVMILSYAALILGSLLSIGFLVITQGENINLKTPSKLTSQQYKNNLARTLDNISYRVLGFGFPLLTIGILSGAVWANEAWGSYWSWDPKETWALLTWLVFAIYLHTRLTKGWEGQKPALIASLGFITVWICFLGVNLIGEGLHSYGWITT
jgi:cytochrome c-type biogenesis protein CcsB